jgi:hypothetical protein
VTGQRRIDAACAAVERLAAHPSPESLSDGLSPVMASHCLQQACAAVTPQVLEQALDQPGRPPRLAAVVAARGVFTAPLEWSVLLAAAGAELVIKAPAAAPAFCRALAQALSACGLPVRCTTERSLPSVDALVAMGGDEAMAELASVHARARLSLHGHRFSLAVIQGDDERLAQGLAEDALLYDGRGCFTPVAVLHLGEAGAAAAFTAALSRALEQTARRLAPGPRDPLLGPHWRRRTGLARALGALTSETSPCTALLPPELLETAALPGFLPVHHVAGLQAISPLLSPWRRWLAACATDLDDPGPLLELGFERLCRPGRLQRPPLHRPHGGREMLRPLMMHASIELPPSDRRPQRP